MTQTPEQVRDEAAEKFCGGPESGGCCDCLEDCLINFKAGWDEAQEYFAQAAGEYDENCSALSKWIGDFQPSDEAPTYGDVARWQFKRDAATIGALKAENETLNLQYNAANMEAKEYCDELETKDKEIARLREALEFYAQYPMSPVEWERYVGQEDTGDKARAALRS